MSSRLAGTAGWVAVVFSVVGILACSTGTEPDWSILGDWAGVGPVISGSVIVVDLQVDSSTGSRTYGHIQDADQPVGRPSPCGQAKQHGVPFVGQMSGDTLRFDLRGVAGGNFIVFNFLVVRVGSNLELSVTPASGPIVTLTPC